MVFAGDGRWARYRFVVDEGNPSGAFSNMPVRCGPI